MEDVFLLSSLAGAIRDQTELEKAFRAFDAVRFGVRIYERRRWRRLFKIAG